MDYTTKHKFLLLDEDEDPYSVITAVVNKEKKEKQKKVKEPKKTLPPEPVTKPAVEIKKSEAQTTALPVKSENETKQGQQNAGRGRGAARGGRVVNVDALKDNKDLEQSRNENRPTRGRGGGASRGRGGRAGINERSQESSDVMADRFGEVPKSDTNRSGYGRGGARRGVINRPARNNDENFQGGQENESAPRERNYVRGGRGGRRGGNMGDRHSGSDVTGVRSVDKKDGHGAGNWGDIGDQAAGEVEPIENKENEPTEENAAAEPAEQPVQPEEKTLTLNEFRAQIKKDEPQFKTRKAGEGQDTKVYSKLVPLKKGEIEDEKAEYEVIVNQKQKKDVTYLTGFKVPDRKFGKQGSIDDRATNKYHRSSQPGIIKTEEFPQLGTCA